MRWFTSANRGADSIGIFEIRSERINARIDVAGIPAEAKDFPATGQ
jgi:hypothetical protein